MFRTIIRRTIISNVLFVAGYTGGFAIAHYMSVRSS